MAPALESVMAEVESLAATSALPQTVDRDYWDGFICDVLQKERFGAP